MLLFETSEEKHKVQLPETLHCREGLECPSYSSGQGIRGKIGLQFLALNGCLVLLDCHGGEKNQGKSCSFSLSRVIHVVQRAGSEGRCPLRQCSAGGEETIALSSEGSTVMQITHPITDALSMPLTTHLLIKTRVAAFFYKSSSLLLQGVNWVSSR